MSDLALPRVSRRSRSAATRRSSHWLVHLVLILGGITMLFPFVWQIILSLSTQAEAQSATPTLPSALQWSTYADVFQQLPFLHQFWVSVLITVLRTVGQLALCSLGGYAFARMPFRGRGLILACILSILMVPGQAFLLPQYQIVEGLGWLNTVQGIVAPGMFSAFGTFLMRQFFLGLPEELEEAARLDGCNPLQIFWKIMMPLMKPAVAALGIITILWSWNDLLWPLVVATDQNHMPLSVGLATLQGNHTTDLPLVMAASLLAMAPILVMFLLMQRRVIDGIATSGLK